MNSNKLDSYSLMIVSKYFQSIDDFINLEIGIPKARGNMSKFHFNPIPLDKWSRQFFTSLETLHVYDEHNDHFPKEEFFKKIIYYEVDYEEYAKKKENEIYKRVVLNQQSARRLGKIPEGVTRIAGFCFFPNNEITEIIMPNSVTSIEHDSLRDMGNVTRIVLSTNLKKISSWCFCRMGLLKEIEIPDSVTSIGGIFLSGCNNLTSITIPTHWERVGNRFVNNKSSFSTFRIPPSVQKINGEEVAIEEFTEFDIPSYVTKLDVECFRESRYTKITIPETVKELPFRCFCLCYPLKELTIPTTITRLGGSCFSNCGSLTSLIIPTSVVEIGNECFGGMTSLKSIEIPSSVRISDFSWGLLASCSSLTSITLHDNYNQVKDRDFENCTSLSSIVLPSTVTRIGKEAFKGCQSLKSINLENVKVFGESCFNRSGITKQNHPELPDHCFE